MGAGIVTASLLPTNDTQWPNSRVSGQLGRLRVVHGRPYPDRLRSAEAAGCRQLGVASSSPVASPPHATVDRRRIAPTRGQVLLVVDTLGLGKGQLAGIFGVTMPDIYAWLGDPGAMNDKNAAKMRRLAGMLAESAGELRQPLYHRYVTERIEPETASILGLLRQDPWDEERIRILLGRARADTAERQKRQERGLRPGSEDYSEKTLVDNLVALGAR